MIKYIPLNEAYFSLPWLDAQFILILNLVVSKKSAIVADKIPAARVRNDGEKSECKVYVILLRTKDLQRAFDTPCGKFCVTQLANCELFDEPKKV